MDNTPIAWLWNRLHQQAWDNKNWNENKHPRDKNGKFKGHKTDISALLGIKTADNITIANTSFHFKKRLHQRYNSLKLELLNGNVLEGTDSVAYILQHPNHIKYDKVNKKIEYYYDKIICIIGENGTLITIFKRKRGFKF